MAISDGGARAGGSLRRLRHVRCPRCNSVLEEPTGVPVYQCGGCGASLRAKFSSGEVDTREAPLATPSVSAPPSSEIDRLRPPIHSWRFDGAGDLPGTPRAFGPDAPSSSRHRSAADTTTTSSSSLLSSARKHGSDGEQAPPVGAPPSSESGRLRPRIQSRRFDSAGDLPGTPRASSPDAPSSTSHRDAADTTTTSPSGGLLSAARKHGSSGEQAPPVVEKKGRDRQSTTTNQEEAGVSSPEPRSRRGSRDGSDSEKRREPEQPKGESPRKNRSVEAAARPRRRGDADEAAATATAAARTTADSEITGDDTVKMSPLHEKILKTVDELRGDLSELFSKSSPEVEPTRTPARRSPPPLLPGRDRHVSRRPAASPVPTSRARHADTGHRRGSKPGYATGKVHGQVAAAPRGLPSRRYRRCRADHSCARSGPGCCKHGAPECRSHCCGSKAQEPAKPTAVVREAKRRAPPREHCRPVLKGAPFIVCSSCFALVQVPAGFAVPNKKVSKLRCGACSAVLSYSYRDPDGKKKKVLDDQYQYSTDGGSSDAPRGGPARPDLFSFIEDFAHGESGSYSTTEDEQPLHVSRNSSLSSTVVGASGTLHRLMGYGSARELLLLPRSPSLFESFPRRAPTTTSPSPSPPDRKGKGVWVDDGTATFDDDSDDDSSRGALRRRSGVAVAGWKARGGRGAPAPAAGPIRIRS